MTLHISYTPPIPPRPHIRADHMACMMTRQHLSVIQVDTAHTPHEDHRCLRKERRGEREGREKESVSNIRGEKREEKRKGVSKGWRDIQ